MVAKMREKPGGVDIPVTIGDFEQLDVEGPYSLIYVVFNTLFALPSQEAQVNCFRSVAEHLTDDGAFLIEAFVPDPTRFDRGQRVSTGIVETDFVSLDLDRHDPTTQTVASFHLYITPEGVQMYPVAIRYAWPSEARPDGPASPACVSAAAGPTGAATPSPPPAPATSPIYELE